MTHTAEPGWRRGYERIFGGWAPTVCQQARKGCCQWSVVIIPRMSDEASLQVLLSVFGFVLFCFFHLLIRKRKGKGQLGLLFPGSFAQERAFLKHSAHSATRWVFSYSAFGPQGRKRERTASPIILAVTAAAALSTLPPTLWRAGQATKWFWKVYFSDSATSNNSLHPDQEILLTKVWVY